MYTIRVDGQELCSPALSDEQHKVLSPKLQLEVDAPGSLSFTLPPNHAAYDSIRKMKSVVTMEWEGKEVFRGRVLEEKTDFYNQKEVYCEGDLSFLLDSVQRPSTFDGTILAYIEQAIASHNAQVEADKRFTLGNFAALTDNTTHKLEIDGYSDTLSSIRAVLENTEGFLFTRYENSVRYLDFLTAQNANNSQIEFGINLLDLDNQTVSDDFCTILLPVGGMLDDGTTVTIESVNNGKDTIEDAEGIAKYGRIIKTFAFDDVTDPAELLRLAQNKLASMAFAETMTIRAVDMHLLDNGKGLILPGVPVLIHATPQGIDNQHKICTALDLDPDRPEEATYTFGEPEKTQSGAAALITNKIERITRIVKSQWKHYTETDYTVKIHAGLLGSHDKYLSEALIELDGINAKLLLKADQTTVTEQGKRITAAEVAIDGANAEIELKVSKNGVVSAINQTAETIKIQASKINLSGYVTASQLSAELADFELAWSDTVATQVLSVSRHAGIASMTYGGSEVYKNSKNVVTEVTFPTHQGTTINYVDANGVSHSQFVVTGFATSSQVSKNTVYYLGY